MAVAALTSGLTAVGTVPGGASGDVSNAPGPVLDQWDEFTQVIRNEDGSMTATFASTPIQQKDPASPTGWSPIDTTLSFSPDGVEPELAGTDITFSDGGTGTLASVATDEASLSMDWSGTLPPPVLSGDSATYAAVLPGVDMVLQARPEGFEQSFVVKAPPQGPLLIDLPLHTTGATASLTEGGMLVLTDSAGAVVGTSDVPTMWGAATDPATGEPTVEAVVPTSLATTEAGQVLQVRPDPAFFDSPGLTYPVTIVRHEAQTTVWR